MGLAPGNLDGIDNADVDKLCTDTNAPWAVKAFMKRAVKAATTLADVKRRKFTQAASSGQGASQLPALPVPLGPGLALTHLVGQEQSALTLSKLLKSQTAIDQDALLVTASC